MEVRAEVQHERDRDAVAQDLKQRKVQNSAHSAQNQLQMSFKRSTELDHHQQQLARERVHGLIAVDMANRNQERRHARAALDASITAGYTQRENQLVESNRQTSELIQQNILLRRQEDELEQYRNSLESVRQKAQQAREEADELKLRNAILEFSGAAVTQPGTAADRPDTKVQEEIHRGLAEMIIRKHGGGGDGKKRVGDYPPELRAFYGAVLCMGGLAVLAMVCTILGGPEPATVTKWRKDGPKLRAGMDDDTIRHNFETIVHPLLIKYGLTACLFALGEDATASRKHLDLVCEVCCVTKRVKLMLYGCNGGAFEVTSLSQMAEEIKKRGFATNLYAVMLIALVAGGLAIPVALEGNAGTTSAVDIKLTTQRVVAVAADHGIQVVTGVGDGAAPLRSFTFLVMFHVGDVFGNYLSIPHPFIPLKAPWLDDYGNYQMVTQDFMHDAWRIRTNAITPTRPLWWGTISMCIAAMLVQAKLNGIITGCHAYDGDHKRKQEWGALRRMAGVNEQGVVNSPILERLWERVRIERGCVGVGVVFARYPDLKLNPTRAPNPDLDRSLIYTITNDHGRMSSRPL